MEKVKNLVIGFGKAGKTLAAFMAEQGEKTMLVEKSPKMYGGTCINVACIPSKFLTTRSDKRPLSSDINADFYKEAIQDKKELIAKLNNANYHNVADKDEAEVVDGLASFKDDHTIIIDTEDGKREVYAERIFINTGAVPAIPPIDGLEVGNRIYTSESLMDLEEFPERLTILGGGFIGLEFAATYAKFGSKVTVIDMADKILPSEDRDVAEVVYDSYKDLGVDFIFGAEVESVSQDDRSVEVTYSVDGKKETIVSDGFLVATGRNANSKDLNLENAGVETDDEGFVKVNKHLQTNKDHIFAVGDIKGGAQFTYVSLDDYRIVKNFLYEDGSYTLEDRKNVAFSAFLHPTFSKVGLGEEEAKEKGYNVKVGKIPASSIPKAKVLENQTGVYKAVIDADTDKILGVVLFGEVSHEVINVIVTAMQMDAPYTMLANQIYTHPTMSEALNNLFGAVK